MTGIVTALRGFVNRQAVIALRPVIRRRLLRLSPNHAQHLAAARRLEVGAAA